MGDTKNTDTVTGAANSTYAAEGGYGPGPELRGDEKPIRKVGEPGTSEFSGNPAPDDELETIPERIEGEGRTDSASARRSPTEIGIED